MTSFEEIIGKVRGTMSFSEIDNYWWGFVREYSNKNPPPNKEKERIDWRFGLQKYLKGKFKKLYESKK